MTRSVHGPWLAGLLLCAWGAPGTAAVATADQMELTLQANGGAAIDFHATQAQDSMHTCALFGLSNKEQTLVVTFNGSESQLLLPPSDFGFSLSIAGLIGTTWNERQPSAILQISIGKVVFLGLHASDPAFRLEVRADPDGKSGTFSAAHVREALNGRTIDVKGAWRCIEAAPVEPPDATTTASSVPAPVRPPQAARPALPAPEPPAKPERQEHHFRIYHTDACHAAECAVWTVVETHTGSTFAATVAIGHLKLPRDLREKAEAGEVQFWVVGELGTTHAGGPLIKARRLEGVAPRGTDQRP